MPVKLVGLLVLGLALLLVLIGNTQFASASLPTSKATTAPA